MNELIGQLVSILRGMWKYRWVGLVVAWTVGIVGTVVAFRVPDNYQSMARIFVDTQSILKPLMSGLAVQPNIDQQVAMLSRTLISRPNIEKLIRMADLDLKSKSKAEQDALVESLMKTVKIGSAGRDNLYVLTYTDSDKDVAKRVIQSMVSIFVESSLGASRKDTDSAKVFLDEQIKTYETKLAEAEARVKEFRLRNIDLQLGEGKDSASRLGEISQLIERTQLELREAENGRDAMRKQIEVETANLKSVTASAAASVPEAGIPVSTPEIDGRIEAQKRNLDALMQRFTELHPDIVSTKRLIKDLEDQKRREVAELRKVARSNPTSMLGGNEAQMQQEFQRMLATAEVQVASLKARLREYQVRFSNAKASLRTAPQLEAEAAQLNRDYGIVKKNYEDLVSRRQSAVMSGDLDMASGVADFRLIDPPRVSPRPVSPNRLLLLGAVLLVSLGAGAFSAFAVSQLRPAYHDAKDLGQKTGLPLLGVVSMVMSEAEQRRERNSNLRFYAGTGGLFGVLLVAMITVSILSARQPI